MWVALEGHEAGDPLVVPLEGVDEPLAVLYFFVLDVLPNIDIACISRSQEVPILGEYQHIPDHFVRVQQVLHLVDQVPI